MIIFRQKSVFNKQKTPLTELYICQGRINNKIRGTTLIYGVTPIRSAEYNHIPDH